LAFIFRVEVLAEQETSVKAGGKHLLSPWFLAQNYITEYNYGKINCVSKLLVQQVHYRNSGWLTGESLKKLRYSGNIFYYLILKLFILVE
jgi:hypothetical protein